MYWKEKTISGIHKSFITRRGLNSFTQPPNKVLKRCVVILIMNRIVTMTHFLFPWCFNICSSLEFSEVSFCEMHCFTIYSTKELLRFFFTHSFQLVVFRPSLSPIEIESTVLCPHWLLSRTVAILCLLLCGIQSTTYIEKHTGKRRRMSVPLCGPRSLHLLINGVHLYTHMHSQIVDLMLSF